MSTESLYGMKVDLLNTAIEERSDRSAEKKHIMNANNYNRFDNDNQLRISTFSTSYDLTGFTELRNDISESDKRLVDASTFLQTFSSCTCSIGPLTVIIHQSLLTPNNRHISFVYFYISTYVSDVHTFQPSLLDEFYYSLHLVSRPRI